MVVFKYFDEERDDELLMFFRFRLKSPRIKRVPQIYKNVKYKMNKRKLLVIASVWPYLHFRLPNKLTKNIRDTDFYGNAAM